MCTKCMSDKVLKINDLSNISIDALIDFYKNGYTIENLNNNVQKNISYIKSLATCTDIIQNSTRLITLIPTGVPPYKFELYIDNELKNTLTNKTGISTLLYTFNESIGNHIVMTKMIDNCALNQPQVVTDICTINIISGISTNNYGCINGACVPNVGILPFGCNDTCTSTTCIPKDDEYYIPGLNMCIKKTYAMLSAALITVLIAS